jgi:hypothetical protein
MDTLYCEGEAKVHKFEENYADDLVVYQSNSDACDFFLIFLPMPMAAQARQETSLPPFADSGPAHQCCTSVSATSFRNRSFSWNSQVKNHICSSGGRDDLIKESHCHPNSHRLHRSWDGENEQSDSGRKQDNDSASKP